MIITIILLKIFNDNNDNDNYNDNINYNNNGNEDEKENKKYERNLKIRQILIREKNNKINNFNFTLKNHNKKI